MVRDGINLCLCGYFFYLYWCNLRFKEVYLVYIFLILVILGFVIEFFFFINFNLVGFNCISN